MKIQSHYNFRNVTVIDYLYYHIFVLTVNWILIHSYVIVLLFVMKIG